MLHFGIIYCQTYPDVTEPIGYWYSGQLPRIYLSLLVDSIISCLSASWVWQQTTLQHNKSWNRVKEQAERSDEARGTESYSVV